jgi:glutathione synthase/RimK-type ligase-like ATP-grasp enzyme
MPLANKERLLPELAKEIAAESGTTLTSFSHDWILRLERGGQARHIFGYNFEINSATAQMVAGDKAAVGDLLAHAGIPAVEHRLFISPNLEGYVPEKGNWPAMIAYAETIGYPLVCKPNMGTGGHDVQRVDNGVELEKAVNRIFRQQRGLCLSPYLSIEQEFRTILLDGECQLLYAKQRPHVVGDGSSSVLRLIENLHLDGKLSQEQLADAIVTGSELGHVPGYGQEVLIGWKHNLGEGSAPQIVEPGALYDQLVEMARQAASAINIRFASVDIVQADGKQKVLEINSGVMMEYFVRHVENGREMAKGIYRRAIERMFEPAKR